MLRSMSSLADRLLTAFVPKTEAAAACCPPDWEHEERCVNIATKKARDCHYTCQCDWVCTAWVWSPTTYPCTW